MPVAFLDSADAELVTLGVPPALAARGFTVQFVTAKQIERRRVLIADVDFAAGGLSFMAAAFRQLGVAIPLPADYPPEVAEFMRRDIWPSTVGQARAAFDSGSAPMFVKPRFSRKRFTGRVFTSGTDWPLCNLSRHLEIWCSTPVTFLSEHRIFVVNGAVRAIRLYDGSHEITPDLATVAAIASALSARMAGFAFDVGVLDDGTTALVEVNEGFSVGGYGVDAEVLVDVFLARWVEIT
jgi:hypothetical protein